MFILPAQLCDNILFVWCVLVDCVTSILTPCLYSSPQQKQKYTASTACDTCDLGKFGNTTGLAACYACEKGQYQDGKGGIKCLDCPSGKISNKAATACENPSWKISSDCAFEREFLDDSATDKFDWACLPCPKGGSCQRDGTIRHILPQAGYWRLPFHYMDNNITFIRCPYISDCLGVVDKDDVDREHSNVDSSIDEGCVHGTTGPLCSLCIDGYNRDMNKCAACVDELVPIRVSALVCIVVALFVLARQCRNKIQKTWTKYKTLWRDFIRVLNIMITFSQINSSLPSVIGIQWPEEWSTFLKHFDVVVCSLRCV